MSTYHIHATSSSAYKKLLISAVLILSFACIEAIGGFWTRSLALWSDAGHMGADACAIGISAIASWIAQKPPSQKHSYGLGRAEVLAAWFSSLAMVVLSLILLLSAVRRFYEPVHVLGKPVAIIAFLGVILNLVLARILAKSERTLNLRAVMLHVMSDLAGSFGALLSGFIIMITGWMLIDPILSIAISGLILFSSVQLLRESMAVLMESVPKHLDIAMVCRTMQEVHNVKTVHDLHIWTLSSGMTALSAHVDLVDLHHWENTLQYLTLLLKDRYHIEHVTLQPELNTGDCKASCYR